jgi:DNA-binding MarR family transcriptional regulator
MGDQRDKVIDEIGKLQQALARAFQAAAGPHLLMIDLTMAQLKALIVLAEEGPASIGQVADLLHVGLPTASHLVDRLVKAQLARREEDAADRRRTLASLTPEGDQMVSRLRQGGQEQLRAWLRALADDDLAALAQGMRALLRAAPSRPDTDEAPPPDEGDGPGGAIEPPAELIR